MVPEYRMKIGLSIIELLVVVTIVGILALIVSPVTQVIIARETEITLRRHLREIRKAIDMYHAGFDDNKVLIDTFDTQRGVVGNYNCPLCTNEYTSRVALYMHFKQVHPLAIPDCCYPLCFQELFEFNYLRPASLYNPVTGNQADWDIVLANPYVNTPPTTEGVCCDMGQCWKFGGQELNEYPAKSGTEGYLSEGNGYILRSSEYKLLLDSRGFFSYPAWQSFCAKHNITFPGGGSNGRFPGIFDIKFPQRSPLNRLTMDGKARYSDW